jgi:hypothetical protein
MEGLKPGRCFLECYRQAVRFLILAVGRRVLGKRGKVFVERDLDLPVEDGKLLILDHTSAVRELQVNVPRIPDVDSRIKMSAFPCGIHRDAVQLRQVILCEHQPMEIPYEPGALVKDANAHLEHLLDHVRTREEVLARRGLAIEPDFKRSVADRPATRFSDCLRGLRTIEDQHRPSRGPLHIEKFDRLTTEKVRLRVGASDSIGAPRG